MRITKRLLRRIIKEELLREVTDNFYIKKHAGIYLIMDPATGQIVTGPYRTEALAQERIDQGDLESELATVRSMPWSMQR